MVHVWAGLFFPLTPVSWIFPIHLFLVTMRAVNGQPGPPGPVNFQVYD